MGNTQTDLESIKAFYAMTNKVFITRTDVPANDGSPTIPAGTRVQVVMCSRFGDVGITTNLKTEYGYTHRVDPEVLEPTGEWGYEHKHREADLKTTFFRLYRYIQETRAVDVDRQGFLLDVCRPWSDEVREVIEGVVNDDVKACLLMLRGYYEEGSLGRVDRQWVQLRGINDRLDVLEGLIERPTEPEPRDLQITPEQNAAMSDLTEWVLATAAEEG